MVYLLIAVLIVVSGLLIWLRTNTGVVFLALCTGSVLLSAAGKDTSLVAQSVASGVNISNNAVQLALVLSPGVISALILRERVNARKLALTIIPAIASAVVGLALAYPFLTAAMQASLRNSQGWSVLAQYYEFIVVAGTIFSILTIALTLPKKHKDDKHKHGH